MKTRCIPGLRSSGITAALMVILGSVFGFADEPKPKPKPFAAKNGPILGGVTVQQHGVKDPIGKQAVRPKREPVTWDITTPNDNYQVCIATREITEEGPAEAVQTRPLKAGKHTVCFEKKRDGVFWRFTLTEGEEILLLATEPLDWEYGPDQMSGSSTAFGLRPNNPLAPGVFYRHRMHTRGPKFKKKFKDQNGKEFEIEMDDPGPTNGVLVWIEKIEKPAK